MDLKNLKILSKKDRLVDKYMNNLENINKEPTFREYMSYEEDQRKIRNTLMEEGYKEGLAKGIEEGIEQGIEQGIDSNKIANAKKLYANGVSKEIIIDSLDISAEKLEDILNTKKSTF